VGTIGRSEISGEAGQRGSGAVTPKSGAAPVSGPPFPASQPPASGYPPRRVLFVTGTLAEPALRRVLSHMEAPFDSEVAVLKITVAALMTTPWIARHLEVPSGTDLVLIPGLCEGDPEILREKFGITAQKGPKDLREIPRFFGQAQAASDYGAYSIEILAEINNAPKLSPADVRHAAEYYHASGADIIDIGCTPGLAFPELGNIVAELRQAGMRVSIDTFDPVEIRSAVAAGAELVLSVNQSNLDVARDLGGSETRVVVIPDFGQGIETLDRSIEALERWNVRYLVDPIIEPIGFGFMASLERYAEVHRRYPTSAQLMGVGNITELTSADTTGVNALLLAICEEVGVRAVLTTEVIPWARGAVHEIDIARRLMHYALRFHTVPKGVDDRLLTVKDPEILAYSESELRELQSAVRDPNFRIFTDRETITVFNNEIFVRGNDIQEIFSQLGVEEPTHAFYLGRELMKAKVAITLGKTYRQEGALNWGYLTPPDDVKSEHVRLTQRSRRAQETARKRGSGAKSE
jgi:dihydropteroate synthase